jgi:hypothetical protein
MGTDSRGIPPYVERAALAALMFVIAAGTIREFDLPWRLPFRTPSTLTPPAPPSARPGPPVAPSGESGRSVVGASTPGDPSLPGLPPSGPPSGRRQPRSRTLRLRVPRSIPIPPNAALLPQPPGPVPFIFVGPVATLEASTAPNARVVLAYDERTLPDSSRAGLIQYLSALVPYEQWPQIQTGSAPQPLQPLLTRIYGSAPSSFAMAALVAALQAANQDLRDPILPDSLLRLPPIPHAPEARAPLAPLIQQFDAATGNSGLVQTVDQPFSFTRSFALQSTPEGIPRTTIVSVPREWFARPHPPVPPGIAAEPATHFMHLVGLQSPCKPVDRAPDWLLNSAFKTAAQDRLARALGDPPTKSRLMTLAAAHPLTIVDMDFRDNGHGKKVLTAATYLLSRLGASELAVEPFLTTVNLTPTGKPGAGSDKERLDQLLTDYENKHIESVRGDVSSWFTRAHEWISRFPESPGPISIEDVPSLVVKAVLYRMHLRATWYNVSWQASEVTDVYVTRGLGPLLASGFVFVASGNYAAALDDQYQPQHLATERPNFINISFGTLSGQVYGAWSSVDPRLPVDIMGPGCNFDDTALKASGDWGSSLASPYVAAAGWVKTLLDAAEARTTFEAASADLRASLMAASRPTIFASSPASSVESRGCFDAWELLSFSDAAGPAYVRYASGVTASLAAAALSLRDDQGNTTTLSYSPDGTQVVTVVPSVSGRGAEETLWVRRIWRDGTFPRAEIATPLRLSSLSLTLKTPVGPAPPVNTLAGSGIVEIAFRSKR